MASNHSGDRGRDSGFVIFNGEAQGPRRVGRKAVLAATQPHSLQSWNNQNQAPLSSNETLKPSDSSSRVSIVRVFNKDAPEFFPVFEIVQKQAPLLETTPAIMNGVFASPARITGPNSGAQIQTHSITNNVMSSRPPGLGNQSMTRTLAQLKGKIALQSMMSDLPETSQRATKEFFTLEKIHDMSREQAQNSFEIALKMLDFGKTAEAIKAYQRGFAELQNMGLENPDGKHDVYMFLAEAQRQFLLIAKEKFKASERALNLAKRTGIARSCYQAGLDILRSIGLEIEVPAELVARFANPNS